MRTPPRDETFFFVFFFVNPPYDSAAWAGTCAPLMILSLASNQVSRRNCCVVSKRDMSPLPEGFRGQEQAAPHAPYYEGRSGDSLDEDSSSSGADDDPSAARRRRGAGKKSKAAKRKREESFSHEDSGGKREAGEDAGERSTPEGRQARNTVTRLGKRGAL